MKWTELQIPSKNFKKYTRRIKKLNKLYKGVEKEKTKT